MLLFPWALDGFLRCHGFLCVSYIFRGDAVFLEHEKPYSFYIEYWSGHVAISLVLGMSLEINVFLSQVHFKCIPFNISMEKSCASVEPKSSKQWNSCCESESSWFLCLFDCQDFNKK